jgi:integrase
MKGNTFKRCSCRAEDGRQLGKDCPKLRSTRHGWYFVLRVPGQQHPVKRGGFPTQAAAEQALQSLRSRQSAGTDLAAGQQTVADYLKEWLVGKAGIAADTRVSYASHLRLYLTPGLGALRLDQLRDTHIEELYAAMRQIGTDVRRPSPVLRRLLAARQQARAQDRPLSASRIRRAHATLHSALRSAVRRRRPQHNPAEHIELASGRAPKAVVWTEPRVALWRRTDKRYPVAVWTPEQAGAFLDAVADDRLYALWPLIAYRGLRRGEAVSLAWADVDLAGGSVRVAGTKSETSQRTVSLDAATVGELRAHRTRQLAERRAWGQAWTDTGQVFAREDGTLLAPNVVSDRFDRLVRVTGIPPIRLHDLRHTAASPAYRATRNLKMVSELLGHSGIHITGDIYTSVFEEVDRDAAEAVARLVPRAVRGGPSATVCPHRAHTGPHGGVRTDRSKGKTAGQRWWGGWGSNPRPRDYESPALTG